MSHLTALFTTYRLSADIITAIGKKHSHNLDKELPFRIISTCPTGLIRVKLSAGLNPLTTPFTGRYVSR
ncbi:hypothetical protein YPPY04_2608 [Yersinia pestis PY-04]|nr:hypothetical protein YPPY04_2608 [Yersinia pestis PY-04]